MFGTIYMVRVKPGCEEQLLRHTERWEAERGSRIAGPVAIYLYQSAGDPREFNGVVIFDSRESYQENARDPEQHDWYEQFLDLLEGPPVWMDGKVVHGWRSRSTAVRGL